MQKENNGALGGHQACASCKHQRKKCAEDCVLAPLFPADRTPEFQAVHKLFGVSNVSKLLRSIPREEDRRKAADSLIWEATCRTKDLVQGPYGEYKRVLEELKFYRNQNLMQRGMVFNGEGGGLIGWSNGPSKGLGPNNTIGPIGGGHVGIMNGTSNTPNNSANYIGTINDGTNGNGSSIIQLNRAYNCSMKIQVSNKLDNGSLIVPSQTHSNINGYNGGNQHYYLTGQYNSNTNIGKTAENELWEDGP